MVQQRNPGLQAGRHARAVNLHENVIGEISPGIDVHRSRDRIAEPRPPLAVREPRAWWARTHHHLVVLAPERHLADIQLVAVLRCQEIANRVELGAE